LGRNPSAQGRPSAPELLARLVEMKNKITVRLHRFSPPHSIAESARS
jgi:hypothetical protein